MSVSPASRSVGVSASLDDTVIIPIDLGEASRFDRAVFPLSRRRDSLSRGDLYLDATLDEMLRIRRIDPRQWSELVATTKARYDQLIQQKEELERRPTTYSPFQFFANVRANWLFLAASKSLYRSTKNRSEQVMRSFGRELLSISRESIQEVFNEPPPGAIIDGIAVRLNRPVDEATRQQIEEAANVIASCPGPYEVDPTISEATSSPQTTVTNTYNFYGSLYSPGATLHGPTVQHGGSQNSGSVNHNLGRPN